MHHLPGGAEAWVGTATHFRWLYGVLASVLVLNLADAVLTLYWIAARQAAEANPLLAPLAHGHPVPFVVLKMALVSGGAMVLWRWHKRPAAVVAIFAAFFAYYILFLYHLTAFQVSLVAHAQGWLHSVLG
jgi:hypothetical protein